MVITINYLLIPTYLRAFHFFNSKEIQMEQTIHHMKLLKHPFDKIKSGKKKIEIRLNDSKRQNLKPNDIIEFLCLPELNKKLNVIITKLIRRNSFEEILENNSIRAFGYDNKYSKEDLLKSIYTIYTKEKESELGVLEISIKLV